MFTTLLVIAIVSAIVLAAAGGYVVSSRRARPVIDQLRGALTDVTRELTRDPLTGLHNRAGLHALHAATARSRFPEPILVMLIDLDLFKAVNDTYSHTAGDQLLQAVGPRIGQLATALDGYAARLSGDEFVAVLPLRSHRLARVAELFNSVIAEPVDLETDGGQATVTITASIGVTIVVSTERLEDVALNYADIAMYNAKQQGGGRHVLHTPNMTMPNRTPPVGTTPARPLPTGGNSRMNLTAQVACAVCHEALTVHRYGDHVLYRHPVIGQGHQPIPVDAGTVPVYDRCHLCTDPRPVWNYQTGLIQLADLGSGFVRTYNDQWHVCFRCNRFIEANDAEALTAHSAGRVKWLPGSAEYAQLSLLHQGIVLGWEHRTLLTTTAWPPARIGAAMLPKIRDRFAGLLRSSAGLPLPLGSAVQRRVLADQLDEAVLYWLNDEFTDLVNDVTGAQPAARITEEIVPAPEGLVVWSEPVGPTTNLAAVSWTPHLDGWRVVGYRSIGVALAEDLMPALRHEIGWLIPAHTEYFPSKAALDGAHPLAPLVTTWLLIHQEMGVAERGALPKGTTKAYQRRGRPAPDVRIVRIKPRSMRTAPLPRAAAEQTRAKPDHRFWVSGHERQQPYGPGRSLRRTVDIAPFLKGDEGLPIKRSTTVRVLGRRDGKSGHSPAAD